MANTYAEQELLKTNAKLIDKIDEIQEESMRVTVDSQSNAKYYLGVISELEDALESMRSIKENKHGLLTMTRENLSELMIENDELKEDSARRLRMLDREMEENIELKTELAYYMGKDVRNRSRIAAYMEVMDK